MTAENNRAEELKQLCAQYFEQHCEAAKTDIYWIERNEEDCVDTCAVNRIGGAPIGIALADIPTWTDKQMSHIFTLDVNAMPKIAAQLPEATRAVALFVANPNENEAYSPCNEQAKVVFLSEEDIAKGEPEGYSPYTAAVAMTIHEIQVPAELFSVAPDSSDVELKTIKDKLYNAPAFALGQPIWLQDEEHWSKFLLQFDAKLAEINLGDSGIMYVFDDCAFWQCY